MVCYDMTNKILWDWIVLDSNAMLRDFNDMIFESVLSLVYVIEDMLELTVYIMP